MKVKKAVSPNGIIEVWRCLGEGDIDWLTDYFLQNLEERSNSAIYFSYNYRLINTV